MEQNQFFSDNCDCAYRKKCIVYISDFLGVDYIDCSCDNFLLLKSSQNCPTLSGINRLSAKTFLRFSVCLLTFFTLSHIKYAKNSYTHSHVYAPSMYLLCELSICQSIKKFRLIQRPTRDTERKRRNF